MDGLDPAISHPHQIPNDTIPVSNHPTEMAGSSLAMSVLAARAVRLSIRLNEPQGPPSDLRVLEYFGLLQPNVAVPDSRERHALQ